jgi:hypothetical protein
MAFDFNTFLQENKKLLMGGFVGAALFAVSYAVIDSFVWDEWRSAARDIATIRNKAAKEETYSQKNLEQATAQQQQLDESVKSLVARLQFVTRPEFQLKDGGASPANQYWDIATRFRERRLDDARSRGIFLLESAGIPDRAPTQPDDIRRTLKGLDLTDRILEFAIQAGVRSIDRITMSADASQPGGVSQSGNAERQDLYIREEVKVEVEMDLSSKALSQFLEATQSAKPPLTIQEFRSDVRDPQTGGRVGRGESMVHVLVRFAALDVATGRD